MEDGDGERVGYSDSISHLIDHDKELAGWTLGLEGGIIKNISWLDEQMCLKFKTGLFTNVG